MSTYRFICRVDRQIPRPTELSLTTVVAGGELSIVEVRGQLDLATDHQLTAYIERLIHQQRPSVPALDLARFRIGRAVASLV